MAGAALRQSLELSMMGGGRRVLGGFVGVDGTVGCAVVGSMSDVVLVESEVVEVPRLMSEWLDSVSEEGFRGRTFLGVWLVFGGGPFRLLPFLPMAERGSCSR